jgi:hypothetical protein
MLINIVYVIVEPTTRYHSTLKSLYLPENRGMKGGSFTSDILALTSKINKP